MISAKLVLAVLHFKVFSQSKTCYTLTTVDASHYLYPSDLKVNESGLRRILVVGQCNAREFTDAWKRLFPELAVDYVFHSFVGELPDKEAIENYQVIYIQIPLRSVIGDGIITVEANDFDGYTEIHGASKARLEMILRYSLKYNRIYGLFTLVSNFIVPQSCNAPSLDAVGTQCDLAWLVSELNKDLAGFVSSYQNAYISDTETLASSFGKRLFFDDFFSFSTHGTTAAEWATHENFPVWSAPVGGRIEPVPSLVEYYGLTPDDFRRAVFSQIEWAFRVVHQIDTVKLVVFDLDNTLWRGQIAEHYDNEREWPDHHGWVVGIWEASQILRRRGIPLAIISRNDPSVVESRWQRAIPTNWLNLRDFVSSKITWKAKSESMSELLEELSLTAKGVLFVDDNPIERAEVQAAHPEIRTIGGNPYETRRILLWSAETNRSSRTLASRTREESYRNILVRNKARQVMSRDAFLRDIQIKIKINSVNAKNHSDFVRLVELVNKTNQFNTTGIKWRTEELFALLDNGGRLFCINVTDRFSDYGIAGALVWSEGVIRQYVLSCRVLGLDVDVAALGAICADLSAAGPFLVGATVETEHNGPCLDVFTKTGFVPTIQKGVFVLLGSPILSDTACVELIQSPSAILPSSTK